MCVCPPPWLARHCVLVVQIVEMMPGCNVFVVTNYDRFLKQTIMVHFVVNNVYMKAIKSNTYKLRNAEIKTWRGTLKENLEIEDWRNSCNSGNLTTSKPRSHPSPLLNLDLGQIQWNSIMQLKPDQNQQFDLTTFDGNSQNASDANAVHISKLLILYDPYVSVKTAKKK